MPISMMNVQTYRFEIMGSMGQNPRTVMRDASYLSSSGFRASLTPDGGCDELTMNVRNGINPSDPSDTGLQLAPLDVVRVSVLDGTTWTPIFLGEVRVGGNQLNPDYEAVTIRGLDRRIREVSLKNKPYARQDVERIVDDVMLDLALSGQMGVATITYPVSFVPSIVTASGFKYLSGQQPPLGVTLEITDTGGGTVGALLDKIVEAALAQNPAQPLTWHIDPEGFLYFGLKRADVLTLAESDLRGITWSAPVSEAPVTAVLWLIERRYKDGPYATYVSRSPETAQYGDRVKTLPLDPADTTIWQEVPFEIESWFPDLGNDSKPPAVANLKDDDPATRVNLRGTPTTDPYVRIRPSDVFDRVVVESVGGLGETSTGVEVSVFAADGSAEELIYREALGQPLKGNFYPHTSRPAGDLIQVHAYPEAAGDQAGVFVSTLRPQQLNRAMLDARAGYHYKPPARDPADAELPGFIAPTDFRGRLALTPSGYNRALERFEYRLSADGWLATGLLTGQADDPEVLARSDVIKQTISDGIVIAIKTT